MMFLNIEENALHEASSETSRKYLLSSLKNCDKNKENHEMFSNTKVNCAHIPGSGVSRWNAEVPVSFAGNHLNNQNLPGIFFIRKNKNYDSYFRKLF